MNKQKAEEYLVLVIHAVVHQVGVQYITVFLQHLIIINLQLSQAQSPCCM